MRVKLFGSKKEKEIAISQEICEGYQELYIRDLAFWSCVELIARCVSKCEFKKYHNGKEAKDEEWYLWNIAPNQNENSSQFLQKLVTTLYRNNEVLVVENDKNLYVADSFAVKEWALKENIFSQVTIGDFTFQKDFFQSEVIYLKLNEQNLKPLINGLYDSYSKLITAAQKGFTKGRGSKGVLNVSAMASGSPKFEETFRRMKEEYFKAFFESDNAVLPLFEGYEYHPQEMKTYSNESSRDIRAMIDDISDFTAKIFGIPPALIRGDVEGVRDALDLFLAFCIDPLTDMISEEINRKRYRPQEVLNGNFIRIDTKTIKHIDLLSVSGAVDKLISCGAFTINDIRKITDEEEIQQEWANKHFITKNYAEVSEVLAQAGEGEQNE